MKHTTAIALLLMVAACDRDGKKHENPGYPGVLDSLGISHRTLAENLRPPDLKEWPKDGAANGVTVRRITGAAAGLPLEAAPHAKFVTTDAIKQLDVARQGTGLFIVDTDYVPRELPEMMKSKGLTLRPDGSLFDSNSEPVALLIQGETYAAQGAQQVRTSMLNRIADAVVTPAHAATPFPWRCFSFSTWAVYHSGFHRWYEAGTDVSAFGADAAGGCSAGSPATRIDFLQARTAVRGPGTQNFCFACPTQGAYDKWDVGYWWPAHGVPTTTHSGVWADGRFSFSRTANRSW